MHAARSDSPAHPSASRDGGRRTHRRYDVIVTGGDVVRPPGTGARGWSLPVGGRGPPFSASSTLPAAMGRPMGVEGVANRAHSVDAHTAPRREAPAGRQRAGPPRPAGHRARPAGAGAAPGRGRGGTALAAPTWPPQLMVISRVGVAGPPSITEKTPTALDRRPPQERRGYYHKMGTEAA